MMFPNTLGLESGHTLGDPTDPLADTPQYKTPDQILQIQWPEAVP